MPLKKYMRCDGDFDVVLHTTKLQHLSTAEKRIKADKLHRQLIESLKTG